MRLIIGLFALVAAAVVGTWAILGAPVSMPQAPLAPGDKLHCISYAPFRNAQSPLDAGTMIEPWQIDEDLTKLAQISRCVRTYSVDYGLDRIAESARKHGLKVIQGLWLSSNADKNRYQIETTIALANKFPDVIQSVVVGNEVLLRGEISANDLANIIRGVKARVSVPVTYADVWEFWLRFPQIYEAVDFVTIHILPYWEDFPVAAREAATHVDAIRRKVAAAYPDKEILIGEVGWPSAGRMREGALPSPSNQALVVQEVLALAKRDNVRVNIIEAFDQPWKRWLEGTVGGHWGVLDNDAREPKFVWGQGVSDHPRWVAQSLLGVGFVIVIFAAAYMSRRHKVRLAAWLGVAGIAAAGGILVGWTIEDMLLESLGLGGWIRSIAFSAIAFAAPPLAAAAITSGVAIPSFASVLNRKASGWRSPLLLAYGVTLIVTTSLAVQVALGLVFDSRYRDFPFAALTAGVLPFFIHGLLLRADSARGMAETVSAATLALSILYIVPNETLANWQSLWMCAALAALAFTLVRVRGAQG